MPPWPEAQKRHTKIFVSLDVTCENVRFALHLSTCVEMSTKSCNFCFQTCKVTRIMQEKCVQLLHSLASAYPQGRRRSCPSGSPQKKSLHIHMKAKRIRMASKKKIGCSGSSIFQWRAKRNAQQPIAVQIKRSCCVVGPLNGNRNTWQREAVSTPYIMQRPL